MTRRVLLAALLALPATGLAADPPKTFVMERAAVNDKALGKTPACTLFKPKGWAVEGKVIWAPATIHQANLDISVSDPDSMQRFKTTEWTMFASDSGNALRKKRFDPYYHGLYCDRLSPTELHAAVVEQFGDKLPTGMKVAEQKELPEVAKVFAKLSGMKDVQAGRTRMAYKVDGVAVEEDFYLVLTYVTVKDGFGGTFSQFYPLVQPFSLRAEKGKLDEATPRLMAVAYSLQPTQEYGVKVLAGLAKLMEQFFDEQAAVKAWSQSISANNDAMLEMIRTGRKARWDAEDRAAKKFSDYIRGVDSYTDGKASYTVPYGYSNVWADGNGTVILSNDRNYDPNRTERGTWSELTPVK